MLVELQKYIRVESLIPTFGVFILTIFYFNSRKKNYPPGPKGLPILGCVTRLGEHPSNTLTALARQYGQIFSIQIGLRNWVVLNDYESIRKALLENGDAFSGRPDLHLLRQMGEGIGVIFADQGPHWKTQKKFEVATLRELSMVKSRLETLVMQEITHMAAEIEEHNGVGIDVQRLMTKVSGNVMNELMLGTRFNYDDEVYNKLISCLDRTFFDKETTPIVLAMLVAPITRFLPGFRTVYSGFSEDVDTTFEIITVLLEEHKKTYHHGDVRGFVDAFLKVMKKKRHEESFKERQVFQFIRELFLAGSANISVSVMWCLLCFINHPECQEKIAEEIERVIGESGKPSMKHKDSMPYTSAFIHEIMRHRTLTPLSMPHKTTMDVRMNGFIFPRDNPILTNFWAVHHDPDHFKNPDEFRPERFLDGNGNFEADPRVIPFSFGPRTCSGEQVAKTEMFMFVTAIVQRYRIKADPKSPPPKLNDGVFGVLYAPQKFDAIFETR